jgi:hypothetical protein
VLAVAGLAIFIATLFLPGKDKTAFAPATA